MSRTRDAVTRLGRMLEGGGRGRCRTRRCGAPDGAGLRRALLLEAVRERGAGLRGARCSCWTPRTTPAARRSGSPWPLRVRVPARTGGRPLRWRAPSSSPSASITGQAIIVFPSSSL
ncbi:hypothetical protein BS78_03G399600 [Paspalum vaginatum]|nr:hypothetical protein BS78_03G399600 [Paspalum vaginatum]